MHADVRPHAEIEVEVPFHDVDSMDVVWHGHYAKYLELARCTLLDRLGYNYTQMRESGYAWPVIDMQLRYINGARFGQRLRVRAELVEWQNKLRIDYRIFDASNGQRITRASTSQVAVKLANGELQLASPHVLLDIVQRFLESSAQ